ncbi:MAG: aldo/keto reductase [Phycisphaerae bacterium]|nr:aldo/keto reductase [Phycisphaerae bacterium]
MSTVMLPRLGLGTVALGRSAGLKYARPVRVPTDDEAEALLRAALEEGVTYVDTAPAYGAAEQRLGRLLPRVAPRERWLIGTKAGETFDEGTGTSAYDFSPGAIGASVDASLRRLKVERVDVLLLHFSSACDDAGVLRAGEAAGALQEARRAGKARWIGASIGTMEGAEAALAAGWMDVVMVTLNPAERQMAPVAARAAAQGVAVLVKKPLASGRAEPREAVRQALATPGVSCVVAGTTRVEHLRALAAAARDA